MICDPKISEDLEQYLESTAIWSDGSVYEIKRYIGSISDLRIEIYPKDHLPAHFHVISKQRRINARFDITTLELINVKHGSISGDDVKKIQALPKTRPLVWGKLKKEFERMS